MYFPFYIYPTNVFFGNTNYDVQFYAAHDGDVEAPPNAPVTSLLSGTITDLSAPSWGKQVTIKLDTPIGGHAYFAVLHLSAINPRLSLGQHVVGHSIVNGVFVEGTLLGWVGGGNTAAQYLGTQNPTGSNFLNTPQMSSQIQCGFALYDGHAYGGPGWKTFPPVDWSLDPTPIIHAARVAYWACQPKAPQYVDISSFQPATIDWNAYKSWASQWDGIARLSLRVNQGTTAPYVDTHYKSYRDGARAAGITALRHYHYAYPQYNDPLSEANFFCATLGAIPDSDSIMLDFEENTAVSIGAKNLADWAYQWLVAVQNVYHNKVGIYASRDYILNHLQDSRLSAFPLTLAKWSYDPLERPQCPSPWSSYDDLQFTDHLIVPGFGGAAVDADIYTGVTAMGVPTGWNEAVINGDKRLFNPENTKCVRGGFLYAVENWPGGWKPSNVPMRNEEAVPLLERSNSAKGGGVRQVFRSNVLEMLSNQGNKVAEGDVGAELDWYQNGFATDEAAISKLTADLADCSAALALCRAAGSIPPELQAVLQEIAQAFQTNKPQLEALTAEYDKVLQELQPFLKT